MVSFIYERHFDLEQSHFTGWSYYFIHEGHFNLEQPHFTGLAAIDGPTILDLLL